MSFRCAVLGSPIAHSLSPVIHRTAYALLGLDAWSYDAFDVDADALPDFVAGCGPEWVGLSCTMPLKEKVLELGEVSERARLLRSGNTFLFGRDGAPARVENTDVAGILNPLRETGVISARSALLVGAGATARSSLLALAELGVTDVSVVARDVARAHASLDSLADALGQSLDVRGWGIPETGRRDVLISTVPAALDPTLASVLVSRAGVVFDISYGHGASGFASAAAEAGVPLLDGLDMLVGQAVDQIALMTQHHCPAAPLLAAARAESARRTGDRP